jgi:tetratricopeptide (TPR) repeat protein
MGLASAVTNSDPVPDHIANFRKSKKNTEKAVSNELSGKHGNEVGQTLLSTVSEPLTAAVNEVKNTEDMLSRSLSEKQDNIPRNRPDTRPFNSTPRITSDNPQDIVEPMSGPINDPTNDPIDDLGDRLSPSERLYQKGQAYHRQNRYYQAIQMYEGVLELHPDHEAAQFNLASAYIAIKDYSGAKPLLETLSQDGKDNAELLLNLSIVAIGTGDPEAALKYLAQLEQKSPRTNFDLFFHRGVAYRHLDQNEKAFEWYRRAYQLNSSHPQLVFNMAVACDVLKRYAEAIEYYAKYIDLFKDIQSNEERQIKRRISQLRTFTQVNLNRH